MSMQIRADQQRRTVARHGRRLQYLTIAWNSAECLISIGAGIAAGSIALIGFGFDSAIEVASSLAALWRLARDQDETARERAERRTLRIIGVCFVALSLSTRSKRSSTERHQPRALSESSSPGSPLSSCRSWSISSDGSPLSSTAEPSKPKHARPRSARFYRRILLSGLALNAWLGWWWADPLAGLVMVPLIAKEGIEALRGETCCEH